MNMGWLLFLLILCSRGWGRPSPKARFFSFIGTYSALEEDEAKISRMRQPPEKIVLNNHRARIRVWIGSLRVLNSSIESELERSHTQADISEETRQVIFMTGYFCKRRLESLLETDTIPEDPDQVLQPSAIRRQEIAKNKRHFESAVERVRQLLAMEQPSSKWLDDVLVGVCGVGLLLVLLMSLFYLYRSPSQVRTDGRDDSCGDFRNDLYEATHDASRPNIITTIDD